MSGITIAIAPASKLTAVPYRLGTEGQQRGILLVNPKKLLVRYATSSGKRFNSATAIVMTLPFKQISARRVEGNNALMANTTEEWVKREFQ